MNGVEGNFGYSKTINNTYRLMSWVVDELLPFNFVESTHLREDKTIIPMSAETLVSRMDLVSNEVTENIKAELPDKFGIIFDGWDDGHGHHLLGIIAVYPKKGNL
jgi:hypothetical protein